MSETKSAKDIESSDSTTVDTAIQAINKGEDNKAESLLQDVIQRTPDLYTNQFEDAGNLFVKFWDRAEFLHYVAYQKDQGAEMQITWIGNAYPRAFFHLGFLRVKAKKFAEAITFLDRGFTLEPSNPKFVFEKAMALSRMQKHEQAMTLYNSINKASPYVSQDDLARALRGRGSVYIELGQLNQAESAFKESLKFQPDSKVAINELLYISQLRQGGKTTQPDFAATSSSSSGKCVMCGQIFTKGQLTKINGKTGFICSTCQMTQTKSKNWWEIWK